MWLGGLRRRECFASTGSPAPAAVPPMNMLNPTPPVDVQVRQRRRRKQLHPRAAAPSLSPRSRDLPAGVSGVGSQSRARVLPRPTATAFITISTPPSSQPHGRAVRRTFGRRPTLAPSPFSTPATPSRRRAAPPSRHPCPPFLSAAQPAPAPRTSRPRTLPASCVRRGLPPLSGTGSGFGRAGARRRPGASQQIAGRRLARRASQPPSPNARVGRGRVRTRARSGSPSAAGRTCCVPRVSEHW